MVDPTSRPAVDGDDRQARDAGRPGVPGCHGCRADPGFVRSARHPRQVRTEEKLTRGRSGRQGRRKTSPIPIRWADGGRVGDALATSTLHSSCAPGSRHGSVRLPCRPCSCPHQGVVKCTFVRSSRVRGGSTARTAGDTHSFVPSPAFRDSSGARRRPMGHHTQRGWLIGRRGRQLPVCRTPRDGAPPAGPRPCLTPPEKDAGPRLAAWSRSSRRRRLLRR